MIDIHAHLLPGIDDGAAGIEQSLALARHAVADGLSRMVLTPHIQPDLYDNSRATITPVFDAFAVALVQYDIDLEIAWAAEVRLCPEIIPMLEGDTLPLFVGVDGRKTLLLELPHSHVPPGTEQLIKWLQAYDVGVLIAHPERNKEIMRNHGRVEAFIDMGCLLQLTAASVAGRFGAAPQRAAEYMLQRGWVTVLASDAHNLRSRPPELSEGMAAAAAILGHEAARKLVLDHPQQLTGGMFGHA